jgi:hypothetical protein
VGWRRLGEAGCAAGGTLDRLGRRHCGTKRGGGGRGTTGGGVGESKEKRFGVFVIDGIVGNFSKNSSHSR